ncbi:hypothetical protein BS78_06G213600 [Paspalum vaginatum]|nr:hypothetical protein BS78_06G213600 [Paspalum vaginatum]
MSAYILSAAVHLLLAGSVPSLPSWSRALFSSTPKRMLRTLEASPAYSRCRQHATFLPAGARQEQITASEGVEERGSEPWGHGSRGQSFLSTDTDASPAGVRAHLVATESEAERAAFGADLIVKLWQAATQCPSNSLEATGARGGPHGETAASHHGRRESLQSSRQSGGKLRHIPGGARGGVDKLFQGSAL